MIDLYLKHQIYQCPGCGNIQQSTSKQTFRCFNCAKSTKIISDKRCGLNLKLLYSTDDSKNAPKIVAELKRIQFETV